MKNYVTIDAQSAQRVYWGYGLVYTLSNFILTRAERGKDLEVMTFLSFLLKLLLFIYFGVGWWLWRKLLFLCAVEKYIFTAPPQKVDENSAQKKKERWMLYSWCERDGSQPKFCSQMATFSSGARREWEKFWQCLLEPESKNSGEGSCRLFCGGKGLSYIALGRLFGVPLC